MTDADAVVRRVFPDRRVSSTTSVHRGNHKRTVLVTFVDDEQAVVQLSTDSDALRTEFALARAIRARTSLPVPRLLAAGELGGTGYVVVERARGVDLHERFTGLDATVQQSIARTFGQSLAKLHEAFQFDGYGTVTIDDDTDSVVNPGFRTLEPTGWQTWFTTYAREGVKALPAPFDAVRGDLLDTIVSSDLPSKPPATLFPWDLRPGNALVDDGKVSAVLDWGEPLSAAPGLSVAKTEHLVADWYVSDGEPLREAFRAGYCSTRELPPVPTVYRLAAVVHSAVDSRGVVTRPRYPEVHGDAAVSFHTDRLWTLLSSASSVE